MNTNQLVQRLISMESEINAYKLRKGTLETYEWMQLTSRVDKLRNAPLIIDDTPALNIFELRAKCRRYKEKYGIEMVVIDYLQLMTGGNGDGKGSGNREQEISQISRSLKSIAKELDVPVIVLSQLNRSADTRTDHRPKTSDLRESGAIEQDADLIMFIYRDEVYNPNSEDAGKAEIIIAKNRHGAIDDIKVACQLNFVSFYNLLQ
jgi:replicative DNA helicase